MSVSGVWSRSGRPTLAHNACSRPLLRLAVFCFIMRLDIRLSSQASSARPQRHGHQVSIGRESKCGQFKLRHASLPLDQSAPGSRRGAHGQPRLTPAAGPVPSRLHVPHQSAHVEPPKDRHHMGEPYVLVSPTVVSFFLSATSREVHTALGVGLILQYSIKLPTVPRYNCLFLSLLACSGFRSNFS